LAVGDDIDLGPEYLHDSADILYEFGFLLIWWMWLKVDSSEAELAYDVAIECTFNLMIDGRFSLAARILSSILKRNDRKISEISLRVLCINKAICDKSCDKKDWRKALERFRWEACTDNFQVVIAALDEDVKKVTSLMPLVSDERIPRENQITKESFRTWPAFKWVRDFPEFSESFEKTFNEVLNLSESSEQSETTEDA
jgi:hypothetical protein